MLAKRPSNTSLNPSPKVSVSRTQDWQSFRVDSIPATASSVSLPRYFGEQDRPRIKVLSLVPAIGKRPGDNELSRLTAVLSFAPKTGGSTYPRQIDEKVRTDTVRIDSGFVGFTPLSFFPDVAVDVVFLPAVGNHPFDCWAENGVSNGDFWPLENLTKVIPKARVLLYGYNPEGYDDVACNISAKADTFRRRFQRLRRAEGREDRPIIFIAHSTGCLVLKRILCDSMELVEEDLVKCVIFLGAPHDGLDGESLKAVTATELPLDLEMELSPGSPTILELNADFAPVADQLHIVACYETRETQLEQGWLDYIVPQDTATLFKSMTIPIDTNHVALPQAQKREVGMFDDIVGCIKDAVNKVTRPAGWRAYSFSNGGPASPISEKFSEEDVFSSSFKSGSTSLSPPPTRMTGLERVQTASSELQTKTLNLTSALRGRKKSAPALQRGNTNADERAPYALHQALRDRDFHTAHELLETFTAFDLKDPQYDNATALHEAAIAGDSEVARALLEAGAMSEPRTHLSFRTPMHYAAMHGHEHIVRLLLEHGSRVNAKSADECTALHNAAERGHFSIVKLLVEREAGVNMLAASNTPVDKSLKSGYTEITKYLSSKGSRPNPRKPNKAPEHPGLF